MSDLGNELRELAVNLIVQAKRDGPTAPTFEEKTDLLKVCSALYAVLRKYDAKPDEGDEEGNFDSFAKQLQDMEGHNVASPVETRNRRRARSDA